MEHGVDPTTLPAVVPTDDQRKRYLVLEGNRRVVALKALETPSLVAPAFDSREQAKLNKLARSYSQNPLSTISCTLFEQEEAAIHWVTIRHTGQNKGVGLVEWGADEKDRWAARHGLRSAPGQILDFVGKHGHISEGAKASRKGIITSLKRLVNTPEVRKVLGIEQTDGEILSWYPAEEVAKGLSRIVEDLKTGDVKVGDIYHVDQRRTYARSIPQEDLPTPNTRFDAARPLNNLATSAPRKAKKRKTRKRKKGTSERTAIIPRSCQLDIDPPRINAIYNELLGLSVDQFPNACSVILRVFVELGVDHYISQHKIMTEQQQRSTPLAKRLKNVASDLKEKGAIDGQLETAVQKMADSRFVLAASTVTFNQYVHNQYVHPKPSELRLAWDELQPFLEKLWA